MINDRIPSEQELALMLGFGNDVKEMKIHLEILKKNGLFSTGKSGVIFCRRIKKDEETRVSKSKAGTLGMKSRYNKNQLSVITESVTNTEDENEIENEIEYIKKLYNKWNESKSLITHKRLTFDMQKALRGCLSEYSFKDLSDCIVNYDIILSDPMLYWYTYKHSIDGFFRKGVQKEAPYLKFLNERDALNNFSKAQKGGRDIVKEVLGE